MPIFDIEKDALLQLTETQLEELIARLAEAEVAALGHSPACVHWSGSIHAPDGGIDVQVQIPVRTLKPGFLERPDTILQAKKHSMPKALIAKEMGAKDKLSPTISKQAAKSGSYIIVSLADDCSPPMKSERIQAMREAVNGDLNNDNIHLAFYDRSKLLQWLRQHPSVMLWTKSKLGQGYSGWQPYGAWSAPPKDAQDTLISAPGVTITLPSKEGQKLSIEDAIEPMRELIRSTRKAIRIIGLSGVGKTRIVQALFDETVGTNALDRTAAIYVDTGAEPAPSVATMADRLIAEGRPAFMIIDNCSSKLHSELASKVSAAGGEVRLITVEYDIRDDRPQTTEVIHIEAFGPDVAEQLLIRRFPMIGQNNARRIAEFAAGNARVSLAIAERLEEGESLAQFSDEQLFNRLFEQRNHPDENLREQAEILSLVYSFSVSNSEEGQNELKVLGSLLEHPSSNLLRSVKKLLDRHVMQKRGSWRAILPHAIANKLAAAALESYSVDQLRAAFEAPGRERLLMSFAHRVGLLHDHPVAKEIVEAWLEPDGLLGRPLILEDAAMRMLDYVGPVAPETLLSRIEAELTMHHCEGMRSGYSPQRANILDFLQSLAYEPSAFDRCIRLLIQVTDHENESNTYDGARDRVTRFFQAYLSGTHASLDQRIAVMNECLASPVSGRRSLGVKMLATALSGPPWTRFGTNEFGARPRNFGFHPNNDQLLEWRTSFIDIAVQLGTSCDSDLARPARLAIESAFRSMWEQNAMRCKLIDAARKLHAHHPWIEGLKAVRSVIYFDYNKQKDRSNCEPLPDNLAALASELEPSGLVQMILMYVLGKGNDYWELDATFDHEDADSYRKAEQRLRTNALQLGVDFATSGHELDELGINLFSTDHMPYRAAFGRGLAKGAHEQRVGWLQLVEHLKLQPEANKNFAVFRGFIEEVDSDDPALARELLDQCAQHPELRHELVDLHPCREFTERDLDRCIAILDDPDICPRMYEQILWREEFADLPGDRVLDLAQRLLSKPNGDDIVLNALSMKLHGKEEALDTLGPRLRLVGLRAAMQRLQRDQSDPNQSIDHHMERVVGVALRFDDNESAKLQWLNTVFTVIDARSGCLHAFEAAISTTIELMPEAFLNCVFIDLEKEANPRLFFIFNGGFNQPTLAKIDIDILIEWCRARKDSRVWRPIAACINIWAEDDTLSASALTLLEASPSPEAVLEAFAERVTPSSWSGSRTSLMQLRADSFRVLIEHENAAIALAARSLYTKLVEQIVRVKVSEEQEDQAREQRFE